MTKLNINYIASELGLAKSTVSKALNGRSDVSVKTRQKVKELVKKLNYTPNHFARALNLRKSKLVGVIIHCEMQEEFFFMVIRGIMAELQKHSYAVVFASSENSAAKEKEIIRDFIERFVDGFIIVPNMDTDVEYINTLIEQNHRFVVVDNYIQGINAPFVGTDFEKGSCLATEYLIKHGHRKIGHLAGPKRVASTLARIRGYKKAFHTAGLKCPAAMIVNCEYNDVNTQNMFMKLKAAHPEMTAVHCAGLDMTNGVLAGMRELEMVIPRDLSIVDFGSKSFITSLDQNGDKIGRTAAEMLLKLLDNQATPQKSIIEPSLIPGNSVRDINNP